MIRRLKMAYELYNFFHKKELIHNVALYKKYGLNKKYYSSISSNDFSGIDANKIIEEGRTKKLAEIPFYQKLEEETKKSIDSFDEVGFCVIKNFWSQELVEKVNSEIERLLEEKEIEFKYRNKLMFVIHKSAFLKEACEDKELLELLDYLIRGKVELFQSINFLSGSEQKTHSDSIHMTTFPFGGLLGVWIALEDIDEENGPIHYYPKSHQLPYYMNQDFDNMGSKLLLGKEGYMAYEKMIQNKLIENKIEKKVFKAKKGDMFIWHANLLHGGEPHQNKTRTRKSMVLHFFDSKRICYHEITQRPALIKKRP